MKSDKPETPRKKTAKTAKPGAPAPVAAKAASSKTPKTVAPAKPEPVKLPASPTKPVAPANPVPTAAAKSGPEPKSTRISKLKVPAILLEGDATPPAPVSGPGQRYAVGPTPSPENPAAAPRPAELPESYGTRQLFLTARDPRWLFAHWDFSADEIRQLNAKSAEGHLALRVFDGDFGGQPLDEIQVHPESRNWFIPVPHGGGKYVAELGCRDRSRQWVSLAKSAATLTPPDSLSEDTVARFATIPYEVPFAQLLASVKSAVKDHVPLAEALEQLRAQGFPELPASRQVGGAWTPAQERALAEVISLDTAQRIWIGSLEITELIKRRLAQELSSWSGALVSMALPSSWSGGVASFSSVSSPFGAAGKQRGFWFNVNAELIIYGATEPDATVTIGDRKIKLRPDGTFSFRFALPDGDYQLPAAAHSADGVETRSADLRFRRATAYEGDVGRHPQDKNLRPPVVEAVA